MMNAFSRPLVLLAVLFAAAPRWVGSSGPAPAPGSGGLVALVRAPQVIDRVSPALEQRVRAVIAAISKAKPKPPPPSEPFIYKFFPQAGIHGRDLFLLNTTDLNPSLGVIQDWDCTGYTYDGHQGHDSVLRSFREQAIGVPVFAVRDGTVVNSHDGEPDMNTELVDVPANYVVIDHGGGYYGLYWHFKRGSVAVAPGDKVSEGTQIGLTGSSGYSSGPHLHFESWKDGRWFEPSAGPCRPGDSFWRAQLPFVRDFYVSGFVMTDGAVTLFDYRSLFLDNYQRTAIYPTGQRTVGVVLDLHNLPGGSMWHMRVVKPGGEVAVDTVGSWGNPSLYATTWGIFSFRTDLDTPGVWRYQLDTNDASAVDLPFTVVADPAKAVNRPPYPVKVSLEPRAPQTGQIMTCQVETSLLERDPDYDVVSYQYQWTVNRRVVRTVTSAALTDVLAKGMTKKKDKVSCRVIPSDGESRAAAALAVAAVPVVTGD
jgi:murein DD-endopeptidase MepM/ murein hydrolase activator NlpD